MYCNKVLPPLSIPHTFLIMLMWTMRQFFFSYCIFKIVFYAPHCECGGIKQNLNIYLCYNSNNPCLESSNLPPPPPPHCPATGKSSKSGIMSPPPPLPSSTHTNTHKHKYLRTNRQVIQVHSCHKIFCVLAGGAIKFVGQSLFLPPKKEQEKKKLHDIYTWMNEMDVICRNTRMCKTFPHSQNMLMSMKTQNKHHSMDQLVLGTYTKVLSWRRH